MVAFLQKALNVRRDELLPASLLFFYLFFMIGAYIIGQSAGDALFLTAFPDHLPHAIIATSVVVGAFVSVYIRMSRRLRLERLIVFWLLFFAGSFTVFWYLTGLHQNWVYPLIFVWVYAAGAMGPTMGWTLANYALTTREARRVFGFIGAGAILGATFAGLFTSRATHWLGAEGMLLVQALTLVIAAGTVKALFATARPRMEDANGAPEEAPEETPGSFRDSWREIRASRYLLLITALIAIGSAATTIIGYQFKIIAKEYYPDKEVLAAFFGRFYGLMGAASFLVQLALTGRLLKSFGIRVTLFVLPLLFIGGSSLVLLAPTLLSVIILKGSHNLLRYSLDKSSAELLYLPVDVQIKSQVKSFIDGFIWRTADGLAGIVLLQFATFFNFSASKMSLVNYVFLAAWVAVAAGVRVEYLNVLRRAVRPRGGAPAGVAPAEPEPADSELLAVALDRGDDQQILHGLSLYEHAREPRWRHLLHGLLHHPSPAIRARVLRLLNHSGDRSVLPQIHTMVHDRSLDVRTEALHYLVVHARVDPVRFIDSGQDFPDYSLQGSVVAYMARMNRPGTAQAAHLILKAMLARTDRDAVRARVEAARVLGAIPPPSELHAELLALLLDDEPEVVEEAIASAGRLRRPEFLSYLVQKLGQPRLAATAQAAIAQYGERAVPVLAEYLANDDVPLPLRRQAAQTMAQIPTAESAAALSRSLVEGSPALRFDVLKALNKIRKQAPALSLAGGDFESVLQSEILAYYRSFQILTALDPEGAASLHAVDGRPPQPEQDSGTEPPEPPSGLLLSRVVREQMDHGFERIFRLLALTYPPHDIYNAFTGLTSDSAHLQANALELIEHMLPQDLFRRLMYALDHDATLEQKLAFAEQLCGARVEDRAAALRALLHGPDRWLCACALYTIGASGIDGLAEDVRSMSPDGDALLEETWRFASSRLEAGAGMPEEGLAVMEKVERLREAPIFHGVHTESLARVARIARNASFATGEALYRENTAAASMFVITDGEVHLVRDHKVMRRVGKHEAVGSPGLLGGRLHSETAVAVVPTEALRIDQEEFYDAMADDFNITRGILRTLVQASREQKEEPAAPLAA